MRDLPSTASADFWSSMSVTHREAIQAIIDDGHIVLPSGSRYICPGHARPDSDWDVYFFTTLKYATSMIRDGDWNSSEAGSAGDFQDSCSMYLGQTNPAINAIAFFNEEDFRLFHDATVFCHEIGGPTDKSRRVEVFEAIRFHRHPNDVPF